MCSVIAKVGKQLIKDGTVYSAIRYLFADDVTNVFYDLFLCVFQSKTAEIYTVKNFFKDLPEIPGAVKAAREMGKMDGYVSVLKIIRRLSILLCVLSNAYFIIPQLVFVVPYKRFDILEVCE